jgi:hypothetical protein
LESGSKLFSLITCCPGIALKHEDNPVLILN